MLRYALGRLLSAVPVLLGVAVLCFLLVRLSGDPTDLLLPPNSPQEARDAFRAAHGLDRPLWEQMGLWLSRLLVGDFGRSFRFEQPAGALVMERMGATLQLAFATLALALLIGVPAGVLAARHRGGLLDAGVRLVALSGQVLPSFYLGILAILLFSVQLRWLPSGGEGGLEHLVLPAATLALHMLALVARVTRSCMLDVLKQDYIRTARAKGLAERAVTWGHALRNAAIPLVTVVGLQFGFLLGGVVVTETVFAWPGVGRLAIQAIQARDFPVVQAVVFIFAFAFVLVNLGVDLLCALLDPRIRHG